ncbi:unannotated protein [freshwater metagenome]|uniref:Unannotated protein n=1 Tax=freshwater metagenome TaxID=449393 RepID=A0A6J6QNL2_9ZZZZ
MPTAVGRMLNICEVPPALVKSSSLVSLSPAPCTFIDTFPTYVPPIRETLKSPESAFRDPPVGPVRVKLDAWPGAVTKYVSSPTTKLADLLLLSVKE